MDQSRMELMREPHPRQREIDARAAELLRTTARITRGNPAGRGGLRHQMAKNRGSAASGER